MSRRSLKNLEVVPELAARSHLEKLKSLQKKLYIKVKSN